MDFTMLTQCVVANRLESLHVYCVSHANGIGHVSNRINTSIPNDVINVDVVTNECLGVVININHTNEPITLHTEVIEERRVLAERIITICREVCR